MGYVPLFGTIELTGQESEVGQKAKGIARDRPYNPFRLELTSLMVPAKEVVLPNAGPFNPWVSQPVWLSFSWTGG